MALRYNDGWVLYNHNSTIPIVCERNDWKNCPEHKHLTDELPDVENVDLGLGGDSDLADDPDDGITSVREYESNNVFVRSEAKDKHAGVPTDGYWDYAVANSSVMKRTRDRADTVGLIVGSVASFGSYAGAMALALFTPLGWVAAGAGLVAFVLQGGIRTRVARAVSRLMVKSKGKSLKRQYQSDYESSGRVKQENVHNVPFAMKSTESEAKLRGVKKDDIYGVYRYDNNSWDDFSPFNFSV